MRFKLLAIALLVSTSVYAQSPSAVKVEVAEKISTVPACQNLIKSMDHCLSQIKDEILRKSQKSAFEQSLNAWGSINESIAQTGCLRTHQRLKNESYQVEHGCQW